MAQGRHTKQTKKRTKKSLVIALVLALLLVAAIGSTVAYLTHSSENGLINSFSPSAITCSIEEAVSGGVKSSVKVKNTGETTAYIRAAVVANAVDKDGNIIGSADVSTNLCCSGWVQNGSYYYFTKPVAPEESTGELLSSAIDLNGKQVTILAEAIQAEPAEAAQSAWGVSPASLGSN